MARKAIATSVVGRPVPVIRAPRDAAPRFAPAPAALGAPGDCRSAACSRRGWRRPRRRGAACPGSAPPPGARTTRRIRSGSPPGRYTGIAPGSGPSVAFFRMSRSICNRFTSRRSRASSSRSSVVSAPARPRPASTSACRTHARSAVSVRSSSRAIAPRLFSLPCTNRTVSAFPPLPPI